MNNYKNYTRIFTDGSKTLSSNGIGIIFDDRNLPIRTIFKEIKENISIKTIEIITIHLALQISIQLKIKNILILTDSKSSCESLKNTLINKNNKFYENEILKIAQNNPEFRIIIQWIPAHSGIKGNEEADKAAKLGANSGNFLKIHIPPNEIVKLIKDKLYTEWKKEFRNITKEKGIYHANIIKYPSSNYWFKKSTLNSKNIKTISRLRTGHAYNKKYLHMIRKEFTPYCIPCNEIENNSHIIKSCKIYDNIRNKYKCLNNNNLEQILINNIDEDLLQICDFLKEIDYKL